MKVLVISQNAFSKKYNNGKTLEAIFSEFKKEDIAQLFFGQNEVPDFDFCDMYFKITDLMLLRSFLKSNANCGEELSTKEFAVQSGLTNRKNSLMFNFAKSQVKYASFLRDLLWLAGRWKSPNLQLWIKNFNPDKIFFLGGNFGFTHRIAVNLSKSLNIPLTTYFTDDYILNPIAKNFYQWCEQKYLTKIFLRTILQSSHRFVIGTEMVSEYSKYFEKSFLPLMNSVPITKYVPYVPNDVIVMSYFGSLHLKRWQVLLQIAKLLPNTVFNVYTINIPEPMILDLFKKANINYKSPVYGDELTSAMINSDILVHVESYDEYYRSLTKLSISTKLPEYLATGRLVLGFGPPELASMKLLSENGIGVVVDFKLIDKKDNTSMDFIIKNATYRSQVGSRGYNFAKTNFNKDINGILFKNIISSTIE